MGWITFQVFNAAKNGANDKSPITLTKIGNVKYIDITSPKIDEALVRKAFCLCQRIHKQPSPSTSEHAPEQSQDKLEATRLDTTPRP